MTNEVLSKDQLFNSIDDTVSQLVLLISSLSEDDINSIPYPDSWTPGQLLRHLTKSTIGMSSAMLSQPKAPDRDPAEKIHHLKKTFLDFIKKMEAPEFIVPEIETYQKLSSIAELNHSFERLKENAGKANQDDLVEGLPFGPTTKLELLHFVLFHTERHLHQLRRICDALKA